MRRQNMADTDTTPDKNTNDDDLTNGIPTELSKTLDQILENKDTSDDDTSADDTGVVEDKKDDETNDSTDDDSTDNDSTDGGDKDADDVTGIDVLGYDAEMVQKLNDIDPNIAKDIRALLERENVDKSSADDDSPVPEKIEKVEIEGGINEEQLAALEEENPAMAAIIRNLDTTIERLSTSLNSVTEDEANRAVEAENKEHYRNFCDTNKKLDGMSKDFPILGMYDKLPLNADGVPDDRNRSVAVRAKIWGEANALHNTGMFGSFEESLEKAVVLYQGKNGENLAMRKVSKELRDQERKMTSRPSKNKTKQKEAKPGSDEFKKKIVSDALKKAEVTA